MFELLFQAGAKGMSERSQLIPCTDNIITLIQNFIHLKFHDNIYIACGNLVADVYIVLFKTCRFACKNLQILLG